jgi:uncharacterized protein YjeT (DUF2065 family)
VSSDSLWLALGLMLVMEGLLPFASPAQWRQLFARLMALTDGQIRFIGLLSMLAGIALLLALS